MKKYTAEDLKLLTLKSNSFCAINNESFTWRWQLVQRMSSNNSFQFLTEKTDLKSERVYHHHASMTSVNMSMEVCNARKCKKERQRRTTTGTEKLKWNLCDDAELLHKTRNCDYWCTYFLLISSFSSWWELLSRNDIILHTKELSDWVKQKGSNYYAFVVDNEPRQLVSWCNLQTTGCKISYLCSDSDAKLSLFIHYIF